MKLLGISIASMGLSGVELVDFLTEPYLTNTKDQKLCSPSCVNRDPFPHILCSLHLAVRSLHRSLSFFALFPFRLLFLVPLVLLDNNNGCATNGSGSISIVEIEREPIQCSMSLAKQKAIDRVIATNETSLLIALSFIVIIAVIVRCPLTFMMISLCHFFG